MHDAILFRRHARGARSRSGRWHRARAHRHRPAEPDAGGLSARQTRFAAPVAPPRRLRHPGHNETSAAYVDFSGVRRDVPRAGRRRADRAHIADPPPAPSSAAGGADYGAEMRRATCSRWTARVVSLGTNPPARQRMTPPVGWGDRFEAENARCFSPSGAGAPIAIPDELRQALERCTRERDNEAGGQDTSDKAQVRGFWRGIAADPAREGATG